MFVWRLSKFFDLSGRGGLAASGRWHTRPKSVVYCADEPETAYAEVLAQVRLAELIPEGCRLLKIDVPDRLFVEEVDINLLDPSWSDSAIGWQVCQPIGDAWIKACANAVLKVPSAARPGHSNFLINTAARDADDIAIIEIEDLPFSGRNI